MVFIAVLVVGAGALVIIGAAPRGQRQRDIVATNNALAALARRVTIAPITLALPTRT